MREKLIEFIRKADKEDYESRTQDEHYAYMADLLIASGVEIPVRCKDCVHMKNQFHARFCDVWCMYNGMGDEGFCNYGERKENES